MISVEANFNMKSIHDYMERQAEQRINEVVDFMRAKGVEYTTMARNKTLATNKYNNITFNLVSSVGFAITRNGAVVESYFPLLETGTEGKAKGEALSARVASELGGTNNIVLVLVAGEDYASYVQNNGKDVISASSTEFESYLLRIWGGNR